MYSWKLAQISIVLRWTTKQEEQLKVYSRKQGDASHRWQKVNEEHHVQGDQPTQMHGEQQGSNASSVDTEDLPIAL